MPPADDPCAILRTAKEENARIYYEGGLAYARGDFAQSVRCYERLRESGAARLHAAPVTIAAAISTGNYPLYKEVEGFLKEVVETTAFADVKAFAELALTVGYLGAMAPDMTPGWLKAGDFIALPAQARLDAAYHRAKYFQCLGEFETVLAIAQTALHFSDGKQGLSYADTYLRLMCAVACYVLGRTEEAGSGCWGPCA